MTQNDAYKRILAVGLLALRDRVPRFDSSRLVEIEAEHLHNIPSLIDEDNWHRHAFYFNSERPAYIAALKDLDIPRYSDDVLRMYIGPWETLLEHLATTKPDDSRAE